MRTHGRKKEREKDTFERERQRGNLNYENVGLVPDRQRRKEKVNYERRSMRKKRRSNAKLSLYAGEERESDTE